MSMVMAPIDCTDWRHVFIITCRLFKNLKGGGNKNTRNKVQMEPLHWPPYLTSCDHWLRVERSAFTQEGTFPLFHIKDGGQ